MAGDPALLLARVTRATAEPGDGWAIDCEFLSEPPPHPSGKYRYTISEVAA